MNAREPRPVPYSLISRQAMRRDLPRPITWWLWERFATPPRALRAARLLCRISRGTKYLTPAEACVVARRALWAVKHAEETTRARDSWKFLAHLPSVRIAVPTGTPHAFETPILVGDAPKQLADIRAALGSLARAVTAENSIADIVRSLVAPACSTCGLRGPHGCPGLKRGSKEWCDKIEARLATFLPPGATAEDKTLCTACGKTPSFECRAHYVTDLSTTHAELERHKAAARELACRLHAAEWKNGAIAVDLTLAAVKASAENPNRKVKAQKREIARLNAALVNERTLRVAAHKVVSQVAILAAPKTRDADAVFAHAEIGRRLGVLVGIGARHERDWTVAWSSDPAQLVRNLADTWARAVKAEKRVEELESDLRMNAEATKHAKRITELREVLEAARTRLQTYFLTCENSIVIDRISDVLGA